MQLARPQHLAAVDVAEAAEHPLVEEHLADRGAPVVVGEEQLDTPVEVGVDAAQIGTESPEPRVPRDSRLAIRLDRRGVEAHGRPRRRLDDGAHLAVRSLPDVVLAVEVPEARPAQVGVEDDAVVPLDLEVLADALHTDDGAARLGHDPDQLGGVEADHLLVDEGDPQRRGGVVDGVPLRHGPSAYATLRRQWSIPQGAGTTGRTPQWARARRMRRSWPPVICSRTAGPTTSVGLNQARSRASCVGMQSPSTGTT